MGVATDGFDINPTFTNSEGGLEPAFLLYNGIPQTFQRPPIYSTSFLNGESGPNYRQVAGNHRPYSQAWNLTIEHRFTDNFYIDVGYVGNKATHLYSVLAAVNALNPTLLSMGSKLYDIFSPAATVVDGVATPYAGWAQQMKACAPTVAQALMPFPQYCGSLASTSENAGVSNYESFQVKAERRAGHGVWLLAAYTNSKLLSTNDSTQPSSEAGVTSAVKSPFYRKTAYSLAGSDIPQTLVISAMYDLPFGKGKRWLATSSGFLDKLVGGWEATTIFHVTSGAPFAFRSSTCDVPSQFQAVCIPALVSGANPWAQSKSNFNPNKPLFNPAAFQSPSSFNFYMG